jgi:hypothetical protein
MLSIKKAISIFGICSLCSTSALAAKLPNIEINFDVLDKLNENILPNHNIQTTPAKGLVTKEKPNTTKGPAESISPATNSKKSTSKSVKTLEKKHSIQHPTKNAKPKAKIVNDKKVVAPVIIQPNKMSEPKVTLPKTNQAPITKEVKKAEKQPEIKINKDKNTASKNELSTKAPVTVEKPQVPAMNNVNNTKQPAKVEAPIAKPALPATSLTPSTPEVIKKAVPSIAKVPSATNKQQSGDKVNLSPLPLPPITNEVTPSIPASATSVKNPTLTIDNISFDGNNKLTQVDQYKLKLIANNIKSTNKNIQLIGYIDDSVNNVDGRKLALQRVNDLRKLLIDNGVDAKNINTKITKFDKNTNLNKSSVAILDITTSSN